MRKIKNHEKKIRKLMREESWRNIKNVSEKKMTYGLTY